MATATDNLSSNFQAAFLNSPNQMGFSVVTLLVWLATCDGELHPDELATIREIAATSKNPSDVDAAIAATRAANPADLQLACEVVRHLPEKTRILFMQMALGVAVEDRVIHHAENHVLRFIADMLGLGAKGLNEVFTEMTGRPFPPVADLSNPSAHKASQESEYKKDEKSSKANEEEGKSRSRGQTNMSRMKALAILGLDEDATDEGIKLAYRRLAKIHHPDRFSSLGSEAVNAATQTFQRIQGAYQYLTK